MDLAAYPAVRVLASLKVELYSGAYAARLPVLVGLDSGGRRRLLVLSNFRICASAFGGYLNEHEQWRRRSRAGGGSLRSRTFRAAHA